MDNEFTEGEKRVIDAVALLSKGLYTDGGHHKQWYMEQAIQALFPEGYEELRRKLAARYGRDWHKGIAP